MCFVLASRVIDNVKNLIILQSNDQNYLQTLKMMARFGRAYYVGCKQKRLLGYYSKALRRQQEQPNMQVADDIKIPLN